MAKRAYLLFFLSVVVLFGFNNCSGPSGAEDSSTTAQSVSCTSVDGSLTSPNSLSDVATLINALPKPLTLDCFLKSLKRPLNIFAVNNTFSAQPAVGNESPRIFIVNSNLSLSVAPAGAGKYLLEMSEKVSGSQSMKAELTFPLQSNIEPYLMFDHIADKAIPGSSRCIGCHTGESRQNYAGIGYGFVSSTIRPNEIQRVFSLYLKNQAYMCDSNVNKYRCDILNGVFSNGPTQDAAFPF